MPGAYYNDNDPKAAAWLRELIEKGHIAPGDVDERGIADVRPEDLAGYRQVHLFAGVGGFSLALRLAGVPDDFPVWTGSCPCQPLSCAGKRGGEEDERHLWPELYRLVSECRPGTVIGEQVASHDGLEWLDGISLDLEELSYAVGSADLPAACVGAPNIRQRFFWGAHRLADSGSTERGGREQPGREHRGAVHAANGGGSGGLGHAGIPRLPGRPGQSGDDVSERAALERTGGNAGGFWSAYDLIPCRDGKARRIERGLQCLVDGVSFRLADGRTKEGTSRVALLKGFGNAINPYVAAKFIRAFLGAVGDLSVGCR